MESRLRLHFAVLAVAAALVMAACGGGSDGKSSTKEKSGGEGGQTNLEAVGLALPGPINDAGFNQGHYEGVKEAAKTYGFEFKTQENVSPEQAVNAVRNLASVNEVVIVAGGQFADPLTTVAPEFPEVQFVLTAGVAEGSNIHSVFKNYAEQSYVLGVLAAKLTKAKKVGFIGGVDIPPTQQAEAGFRAGVEATNPSVEVVATSIGTFNDPGRAKEAATAQIDSGVDVIQGFVDAAEPGVTEAVNDSGKAVFVLAGGHEPAQCDSSDQIVAVSPAQTKSQVAQALKAFVDGDLGGAVQVSLSTVSAEDQGNAVSLCEAQESNELETTITETIDGILSGRIKVPVE